MALSRRSLIIGGSAVLAGGLGAAYFFSPQESHATPVFVADGVAIRGTDPVAYFTEGKPVAGNVSNSHDWNGVTWHFSSAENRDLFAANPEKYAPAYGGYCAWAIGAKGYLASTQPENWAIVDGKLYLNYSDAVQERWDADRPGFIAKGNENWPKVISDL